MNPHLVFSTNLAIKLEIIMEITEQAWMKQEFLKADSFSKIFVKQWAWKTQIITLIL